MANDIPYIPQNILLLIGADLVPTAENYAQFEQADIQRLIGGKLQTVFESVPYKIFNLEVPLCDKESPIVKQGPSLRAPTATAAGIKALGTTLVTLANNHILDQGEQGLSSTCDVLDKNGIEWVGVGKDAAHLKKTTVLQTEKGRIGVYACCEHEFSIAAAASAGANPYDALESFDEVRDLKSSCDYVIVLYHGGKELYRYPSPMLQRVCRKFVRSGADLVVCQHSHCIGAMEKLQGATIVYGQGNFLFDHKDNEYWQTSLLIVLSDNLEVSFIPLKKNGPFTGLAEPEEASQILDEFQKRSGELLEDGFVEKAYREYAKGMTASYLKRLNGITKRNYFFHFLNRLSGRRWEKRRMDQLYTEESLLAVENVIECEAHRELLLTGVHEKRSRKQTVR